MEFALLQKIIQWDIPNWSRALTFWEKHASIKKDMKVLTLGEREGGLSLYFAQKGCKVVCSDYNPFPEATEIMHQEERVSEFITYQRIDMKAIDLPDNSFDIVAFKSVIGALGNEADQLQAIKEIHRVLKPGGVLLFAENATGSKLHGWLRKKFIKWAHRWRYISLEDLNKWSEIYSESTFEHFGFWGLFGRSEGQRKFLSFFDRAFNFLIPKRWKYIHFGVLKKN